jgi:rhodanese-related sulfurtransferase
METIKLLLGVGTTLSGRLMIFDALEMTWREVELRRNPDCPVCGDEPTLTELIDYEVFCGVKPEAGVTAGGAAEGAKKAAMGSITAPGSPPGDAPRDGAGDGSDGPRDEIREVTPQELVRRLESDDPPFLLDVREPWEWAVSSLADRGARLIPLAELGSRLGEIPTDRPVVTYCRTGQRSRVAAWRLTEAGRHDVASLRGGIQAWAEDVEPTLRVV